SRAITNPRGRIDRRGADRDEPGGLYRWRAGAAADTATADAEAARRRPIGTGGVLRSAGALGLVRRLRLLGSRRAGDAGGVESAVHPAEGPAGLRGSGRTHGADRRAAQACAGSGQADRVAVHQSGRPWRDRKSTRLNSSHVKISYA